MLTLIRYRTSAFAAEIASFTKCNLMAGGDGHVWSNDLGCCSQSDLLRPGSAFRGNSLSGFCPSNVDNVACWY